MRHQLSRERSECSRHVTIGIEAGGYEDAPGDQNLAVLHHDFEAVRPSPDREDGPLVDLRHESLLEGEAIGEELIQRNGGGPLLIGQSTIAIESLQGERARRIGEVRRKTFGLEIHADRHLRLPAMHRPAEDTDVDAAGAQMACYGEPIWASTDDGNVSEQLIHLSLEGAGSPACFRQDRPRTARRRRRLLPSPAKAHALSGGVATTQEDLGDERQDQRKSSGHAISANPNLAS